MVAVRYYIVFSAAASGLTFHSTLVELNSLSAHNLRSVGVDDISLASRVQSVDRLPSEIYYQLPCIYAPVSPLSPVSYVSLLVPTQRLRELDIPPFHNLEPYHIDAGHISLVDRLSKIYNQISCIYAPVSPISPVSPIVSRRLPCSCRVSTLTSLCTAYTTYSYHLCDISSTAHRTQHPSIQKFAHRSSIHMRYQSHGYN